MIFEKELFKLHNTGKYLVLILDEAQHYTFDALENIRMLTNIQTQKDNLLTICLVGQPDIIKKVEKIPQLKSRVAFNYILSPFDRDDVEKYIKARLSIAGCYLELFRPKAYDYIYERSNGIPRFINVICSKSLDYACTKGEVIINKELIIKSLKDYEVLEDG
jgi:type II secretory pathway predicted ATPase ExeA